MAGYLFADHPDGFGVIAEVHVGQSQVADSLGGAGGAGFVETVVQRFAVVLKRVLVVGGAEVQVAHITVGLGDAENVVDGFEETGGYAEVFHGLLVVAL